MNSVSLSTSLKNYLYAVFLCSHNCCDCTRTYLYADLIFLPTVAKQSSRRSFVGSFRSPFKVGPVYVSNFQSFPRVDPLLSRKELLLLSLYCLIQTVSLFKNILGSLSKGGKNYKKNIIKSGTLIKKGKIS